MYVSDIQLHEAATLTEAAGLLRRYGSDARVLAGGTDLLVDLKTGRISVEHVISIGRIAELRGVVESGTGIRIGALTTITDLDRSPLISGRFSVIGDATSRMAAPQIRNAATVGGNIASAVPCADLPPVFLVMDAAVVLWSTSNQRTVPLSDFFLGPRETRCEPDEVLTMVEIPRPPDGFGAAYERFALRDGNAIAVAAVAASVVIDADGIIRDARIALGSVAPVPKLVSIAAEVMVGTSADDESMLAVVAEQAMHAAEPITDLRGTAEYRRELVGILTRRAISAAVNRASEAMA